MQKLVRDRIPEIIERNGETPITRILRDDERLPALLAKLNEEYTELQAALTVEEVADMIEVLLALARHLGYSEDMVMQLLHEKRKIRGGFENGVFLLDVQPSSRS